LSDQPARPRLVISAVNLVEAGPLSVLIDCLASAARTLGTRYEIIALVHRASLVPVEGIRLIEYPEVKGSWLRRLYFEYHACRRISRELDADIWLSLHDATPNVVARQRMVYCQNAAPFYPLRWRDAVREPTFIAFTLLYRWVYRINIHCNNLVIVQQDWLRREFRERFGVRHVVVAYPDVARATLGAPTPSVQRTIRFIYPTLPRVFKNIELIGHAARALNRRGVGNFEVLVTVGADENDYARELARDFADVIALKLIGRRSRQEVFDLYATSDCLLFPSKLESWGLPMTEFQASARPILAANLPYAHENLSAYGNAAYFDVGDAHALAGLMEDVIAGRFQPVAATNTTPAAPFVRGWDELLHFLTQQE
jgi:glycosyltransferase involved in cell wall biosynthesis